MYRMLVSLAALAVIVPAPASAAELEIVHQAPVPCSVACAYWDVGELAGYDVCDDPFPEGSYDETRFAFEEAATPAIVDLLVDDTLDYDTFICTDSEPSVMVGVCWSWERMSCLPDDCIDPIVNHLIMTPGCPMRTSFSSGSVLYASGGATTAFVIRSYNWLDPGSNMISISGPVVVTDDSFCARVGGVACTEG